jgi:hypothetical protein
VDVPSPPPYPSDLYDYRSAPFDPAHPLSAFQEALVRSACPAGSRIVDAKPVREQWLPSPIRVRVAMPSGALQQRFLRLDCHHTGEASARALHLERHDRG